MTPLPAAPRADLRRGWYSRSGGFAREIWVSRRPCRKAEIGPMHPNDPAASPKKRTTTPCTRKSPVPARKPQYNPMHPNATHPNGTTRAAPDGPATRSPLAQPPRPAAGYPSRYRKEQATTKRTKTEHSGCIRVHRRRNRQGVRDGAAADRSGFSRISRRLPRARNRT